MRQHSLCSRQTYCRHFGVQAAGQSGENRLWKCPAIQVEIAFHWLESRVRGHERYVYWSVIFGIQCDTSFSRVGPLVEGYFNVVTEAPDDCGLPHTLYVVDSR